MIESALDRNPGGSAPFGTELTNNLEQVTRDIGFDRILIDQTNTTNNSLIDFYDGIISEYEDTDPLEVYSKLRSTKLIGSLISSLGSYSPTQPFKFPLINNLQKK